MGHTTPLADLMCVSPLNKKMFLVDVKGLYRPNPWLVKRKEPRGDLYYILAYVPKGARNRFFVLSQEQVTHLVEKELKRLGRPDGYPVTGFVWKDAEPFEEMWNALPQ